MSHGTVGYTLYYLIKKKTTHVAYEKAQCHGLNVQGLGQNIPGSAIMPISSILM